MISQEEARQRFDLDALTELVLDVEERLAAEDAAVEEAKTKVDDEQ